MKNILLIKNNEYVDAKADQDGNGIQVVFEDVAAADGIELFKGDNFQETLEVEAYESGISATIPKSYLTGSILHFRTVSENDKGDFFHIVFSKTGENFFVKYNKKVVGNIILKV